MSEYDLARLWLRHNGYSDVEDLIGAITVEWKRAGKRTRRNWFEILGGDKIGRRRIVGGREFPIIASVRARQNLPPVPSAITRREEKEPPPSPRITKRWSKRLRQTEKLQTKKRDSNIPRGSR